jgi:hypothetical protein
LAVFGNVVHWLVLPQAVMSLSKALGFSSCLLFVADASHQLYALYLHHCDQNDNINVPHVLKATSYLPGSLLEEV